MATVVTVEMTGDSAQEVTVTADGTPDSAVITEEVDRFTIVDSGVGGESDVTVVVEEPTQSIIVESSDPTLNEITVTDDPDRIVIVDIGSRGEPGPTGPAGPPGGGSSDTEVFTQVSPSATWVVTHSLVGDFPSVTVVDSGGTVVEGSVTYQSTTQLTITFSAAFSGLAYLN